MRRSAFTLVELLTVIALVGILSALLLPAVQAAREAARSACCRNNMRQYGLAVHLFTDTHQVLPPSKFYYWYSAPTTNSPDRRESIAHSLTTLLLPYMEQGSAYSLYRFDKNWQNDANDPATQHIIETILCPSSEQERFCRYGVTRGNKTHDRIVEYFCTDYTSCDRIDGNAKSRLQSMGIKRDDWRCMLAGATVNTSGRKPNGDIDPSIPQKPFDSRQVALKNILAVNPVKLHSITDGLSNTMMIFECTSRPFKYEGKGRGDEEASPKTPINGARWADDESQIWCHTIGNGKMFNITNAQEIFSLHSGGSNFVYGDGSVHFHSDIMDAETFVSCFTAYGDEVSNP